MAVYIGGYSKTELDYRYEIVDFLLRGCPDFLQFEFLFPGLEYPFDFPSFEITLNHLRIRFVREDTYWLLAFRMSIDAQIAGLQKLVERDLVGSLWYVTYFQGFSLPFFLPLSRSSREDSHVPIGLHANHEAKSLSNEEIEFLHVVIQAIREYPIPTSEIGEDFHNLKGKNVEPGRFPFIAILKFLTFKHYGDSFYRDGVEYVPIHDTPSRTIPYLGDPLHLFSAVFIEID